MARKTKKQWFKVDKQLFVLKQGDITTAAKSRQIYIEYTKIQTQKSYINKHRMQKIGKKKHDYMQKWDIMKLLNMEQV